MIPTQIFFNAQGKEIKRHIGFMDKSDILKELKVSGLK
jgi:thioredoxin 1